VNLPIIAAVVAGGALLVGKAKGASGGGGSRLVGGADALAQLTLDDTVIGPSRARVAATLLDAWRGSSLTLQEQLMLLAMAWHESKWDPRAVGTVDSQWGSSYTVFQLRRNVELKNGMAALGLTEAQVVPSKQTALDQTGPQLRAQARLAEWLAQQKGITDMRDSNDEREMVDLAAAWAGLRSWNYINAQDAVRPILRGIIPSDAEIPGLIRAIRAAVGPRAGSPGVLNRLVTYRALKRALLG
jgi:hypothetical protein